MKPALTAILLAALMTLPALAAATSPHERPGPTYFAESLVASWGNSVDEATDGETVPFMVDHHARNVDENARRPGKLAGQGLDAWPWGASHPDYRDYEGVILPVALTNALGHRLEGDVWLPPDARVDEDGVANAEYPGLVLTPGFTAGRDMYDWLLFRLARAGYVVFAWDPQGQGTSHGPAATADDYVRDLALVVRWFHSELNPAHAAFDGERFGLVGHSQGGNAAYWLAEHPEGARVDALVALSSSWLNATVPFPVQTWTGDYDGGFAQPAYLGANHGAADYEDLKPRYDRWLTGPRQLLVAEDATHDSWTNIPLVYGPTEDGAMATHALTWHYAEPFLAAFVARDGLARAHYDALAAPVHGLSRAYPSEFRFPGVAGGADVTMLDARAASLGLDADTFLARESAALARAVFGDDAVTVTGRVMDATGAPVAGAVVRVHDATGAAPRSVTTSTNGAFTMVDVAAGRFTVTAEHPHVPGAASVTTNGDRGSRVRVELTLG